MLFTKVTLGGDAEPFQLPDTPDVVRKKHVIAAEVKEQVVSVKTFLKKNEKDYAQFYKIMFEDARTGSTNLNICCAMQLANTFELAGWEKQTLEVLNARLLQIDPMLNQVIATIRFLFWVRYALLRGLDGLKVVVKTLYKEVLDVAEMEKALHNPNPNFESTNGFIGSWNTFFALYPLITNEQYQSLQTDLVYDAKTVSYKFPLLVEYIATFSRLVNTSAIKEVRTSINGLQKYTVGSVIRKIAQRRCEELLDFSKAAEKSAKSNTLLNPAINTRRIEGLTTKRDRPEEEDEPPAKKSRVEGRMEGFLEERTKNEGNERIYVMGAEWTNYTQGLFGYDAYYLSQVDQDASFLRFTSLINY